MPETMKFYGIRARGTAKSLALRKPAGSQGAFIPCAATTKFVSLSP
jgi:hypothetical protein